MATAASWLGMLSQGANSKRVEIMSVIFLATELLWRSHALRQAYLLVHMLLLDEARLEIAPRWHEANLRKPIRVGSVLCNELCYV